jgi:hypothetical protein
MNDPHHQTVVYGVEAAAKHFGVTSRTIQVWIKKGCPGKSGKRYDLVAMTIWREQQPRNSDRGDPGPEAASDEEGKSSKKRYWGLRHERARALQRKMDYEKRAAEVMEVKEFAQQWRIREAFLKESIMIFAHGLSVFLRGYNQEREMEVKIREQVFELLRRWSTAPPGAEDHYKPSPPEPEAEPPGSKLFWEIEGRRWQALQRELDLKVQQDELREISEFQNFAVTRIMGFKQGLLAWSRALPPVLVQCGTQEARKEVILSQAQQLLDGYCRPFPSDWSIYSIDPPPDNESEAPGGRRR